MKLKIAGVNWALPRLAGGHYYYDHRFSSSTSNSDFWFGFVKRLFFDVVCFLLSFFVRIRLF